METLEVAVALRGKVASARDPDLPAWKAYRTLAADAFLSKVTAMQWLVGIARMLSLYVTEGRQRRPRGDKSEIEEAVLITLC